MHMCFCLPFVRDGALVVLLDLPCHGRSDGLFLHLPDWWAWVAEVWQAIELIVQTLPAQLPLFAVGPSMGGGLAATLCLQRPTFFTGLVLVCPMLAISEDIKPHWVVQWVFVNILARLFPKWPLSPSKELAHKNLRDKEQGSRMMEGPLRLPVGVKPRLSSAKALGFTFPDWMKTQFANMHTPFLVIHSHQDQVTDGAVSQRFHDEAPAGDKTLLMYEGAFHAEFLCCLDASQEIGRFTVEQCDVTRRCQEDVLAWLQQRS